MRCCDFKCWYLVVHGTDAHSGTEFTVDGDQHYKTSTTSHICAPPVVVERRRIMSINVTSI